MRWASPARSETAYSSSIRASSSRRARRSRSSARRKTRGFRNFWQSALSFKKRDRLVGGPVFCIRYAPARRGRRSGSSPRWRQTRARNRARPGSRRTTRSRRYALSCRAAGCAPFQPGLPQQGGGGAAEALHEAAVEPAAAHPGKGGDVVDGDGLGVVVLDIGRRAVDDVSAVLWAFPSLDELAEQQVA